MQIGRYSRGERIHADNPNIWKAYDERSERWVMLKRSSLTNPDYKAELLRRSRRAIQTLKNFEHPSVGVLYETFEADSQIYASSEIFDGQFLSQRVKSGPLDTGEVIQIGLDIASGLAALHSKNIMHRHIKTENIALTTKRRAKLTDQTHVKFLDSDTISKGMLLGTPRAMSPEYVGSDPVDHRQDLFALGILLYEVIDRHELFKAHNTLATLKQVLLHFQPALHEIVPGTPESLSLLIQRLLEKDPEDRPQTATQVIRELKAIAEENPAWKGNLVKSADDLVLKARRKIHEEAYRPGRDLLLEAIHLEPAREPSLSAEFRFLEHLGYPLRDAPSSIDLSRSRGRWQQRLWRVLAKDVEVPLRSSGQPTRRASAAPNRIVDQVQRPSQQQNKGAQLENSTIELLRMFFTVEDEEEDHLLEELRRQTAGSQRGYDLRFSFKNPVSTIANRRTRCRVECKDLSKNITVDDIAGKLLQTDDSALRDEIDHWILISPKSKPSNDLRELLDGLQEKGTFPFTIQIWSPDEGVEEFFGLSPAIYDHYWPNDPLRLKPRDWSPERRSRVREKWMRKIRPHLHLAKVWKRYLTDDRWLRMPHEPTDEELQSVYQHHVTLSCTDKSGRLLGSVDDKLTEWLSQPESPVILLIGEFGDGKTFQSYKLGRKLHHVFLGDPEAGWMTVRFPLRDYDASLGPQSFIESRLRQFGASLDEWVEICRFYNVFAVLDGFDEMSVPLDRESVTESIAQLEECVNRLLSLHPNNAQKILITSRPHFFVNPRNELRLFSRIHHPQAIYLTSIPSVAVWENLQRFSKKHNRQHELRRLSEVNDPIGLAAKPLYLQMIKNSLLTGHGTPTRSHAKEFDNVTVYDEYVRDVLRRKPEFLDDINRATLSEEVFEGLRDILERVALALQKTRRRYVLLADLVDPSKESLARMLWRAAFESVSPDERDDEDAVARIGIRSLLSPVATDAPELRSQWPVDFCHRSMREYFVARALARLIQAQDEQAQELLRSTNLTREVIDFTALMLKEQNRIHRSEPVHNRTEEYLRNLVLAATQDEGADSRLGGNAASLLYAATGDLPGDHWQDVRIDYVDLAGADLSGKSFRGASLRHARLDNAILDDVDFRDSDLTGVVIEQTAPVRALLPHPRELMAVYSDGAIRGWKIRGRSDLCEVLPGTLRTPILGLGWTQDGEIWALSNSRFSVSDPWQADHPEWSFETRTTVSGISILKSTAARTTALPPRGFLVEILNLEEYELITSLSLKEQPTAGSMLEGWLMAVATPQKVIVSSLEFQSKPSHISSAGVVSLASVAEEETNTSLLALGNQDGSLQIFRFFRAGGRLRSRELVDLDVHSGEVSALAFLDSRTLITGGFDRSVGVLYLEDEDEKLKLNRKRRFYRAVACRGIQTEGMVPKSLREKLNQLRLDGETVDVSRSPS